MSGWISASDELRVAVKSFRWVSLFFIIQMMLKILTKFVNARQTCTKDSRSLCLRFRSLYLSKVVFGGLLKAVSNKSQNSGTNRWNFYPWVFRRRVVRIKPMVTSYKLLLFSSFSFFIDTLLLGSFNCFFVAFFPSFPTLRLSMSWYFFAIIANWNWLLLWVQECGGSMVWFWLNEGINRGFDSLDFVKLKF